VTRAATCPGWCTADHTDEFASRLDLGGYDPSEVVELSHTMFVGSIFALPWNGAPVVELLQQERVEGWSEPHLYLSADCPLSPAQARKLAALLLEASSAAESVEASAMSEPR